MIRGHRLPTRPDSRVAQFSHSQRLCWPSQPLEAHPPCAPEPVRGCLSALTALLIYNAFVLGFAHSCMTVMTWLFLVGVAGSLLVVIISFFEDLTELVSKD